MQHANENIVVGLDIGTSKICAVVGRQHNDHIEILGIGQSRTSGLRKGFVINIESTVKSIRKAIEGAELISGCSIKNVVVGIADRFMHGQNSNGMVTLKGREVTKNDVQRVIDLTQAVPLLADRRMLHVIPQEFIVDSYDGIENPLGISGERLEARVHLVTAASASVANIVKACGQAELVVDEVIFQPLASAQAVLMPEERDLGVVMIDIGSGTTDIATFRRGTLRHTSVIPVAGNHLTSDLAVGLRVTTSEAEQVKCIHGCCQGDIMDGEPPVELLTTIGVRNRFVSRDSIRNILYCRANEIFTIINRELTCSGFKSNLAAGAVITGGSSRLPGMVKLAEMVLNMPVRVGEPRHISGLADSVCLPQFSTGVGLVLSGFKVKHTPEIQTETLFDKLRLRINCLWG
ncbi:MAG: cell division protein FtsA [Geobacter sp.]|nr:cell division protein FtsA [Geobacteraceae bacterium]MSM39101.1 cell division protein FtsA [Geobacter sp.]